MGKTKDVLYVTFMGLLLFLSGSIILGGIRYAITLILPIDFISIFVYFFLVMFLTKQVLRGARFRLTYYSIYLPILSVLMYLLVGPIQLIILFIASGANVLKSIALIPNLIVNSYILMFIETKNYFLKNLIANVLGFIAAKEFPNCYESFIKILLDKLNSNNERNINENQIDEILRIFISVLKYCDDECAVITGSVLPVIINIFKISKNNQKNREKCLIIISLFLNKLSYADGNDTDLLSNALDNNSLMENSIYLFTSILISNPKMLLDIKKYTIRILDILVRDMPIYSSKFFNLLIEPAWRLIVLELSLYCNKVVFNKEIEYTENGRILTGKAVDINDNFNLEVETPEGVKSLSSGEVSIIMR